MQHARRACRRSRVGSAAWRREWQLQRRRSLPASLHSGAAPLRACRAAGHILWNIKLPLAAVMAVAVAVCVWEHLRATCCPGLPSLDTSNTTYNMFRVSSFVMSLILALRLRATYERWWDGAVGWGGVGRQARAGAGRALQAFDTACMWLLATIHFTIVCLLAGCCAGGWHAWPLQTSAVQVSVSAMVPQRTAAPASCSPAAVLHTCLVQPHACPPACLNTSACLPASMPCPARLPSPACSHVPGAAGHRVRR